MQSKAQSRASRPHNSEARKKQNRDAQIVSRQRKQAAEVALKERVKRLEDVIEEMSTTFMSFMDEVMIECRGGSHFDGLLNTISSTMSTVIRLTREVVESEDCNSLGINPKQIMAAPVPIPIQYSTPPPKKLRLSIQEAQQENTKTLHEPSQPLQIATGEMDAMPDVPVLQPEVMPQLPPQIFGNGWYHQREMFPKVLSAEDERRLNVVRPHGFTLRLVEEILANSYASLLTDPLGEEPRRVFQLSYMFQNPQSLLYCIRWLLGPGRKCLYRTVDIPANLYAKYLASGHPVGCLGLDAFDLPEPSEDMEIHVREKNIPNLLSAMEVLRKLQDLNCRFVDEDTMEITVPKKDTPDPFLGSGSAAFEAGGVFTPLQNHIGTAFVTMRLSTSLLVKNLLTVSICLTRGPGFPEHELPRLIEASVTAVHEAPIFQ